MLDVIDSLLHQHDLRIVVLAAVVCILSSFACMSILSHARRVRGHMRQAWIAVAAITVGFGIWSTHFVAMLAHQTGFPTGYELSVTLISLAIAIVVCGGGLWIAGTGNRKSDHALGGAIVGIGISAMHYTGMNALLVGGEIGWDQGLIATSLLLGIILGALAMIWGIASRSFKARVTGAITLSFAICTMHFTAMGAADFADCYAVVDEEAISAGLLSLSVGVISILILLLALGGVGLDLRDRRRDRMEASRMRGLADAAVEGLIVCDDKTIVTVNLSFLKMIGDEVVDLAGQKITDFLPESAYQSLLDHEDALVETELITITGEKRPVELVAHSVDFGGRRHNAIAIRDLSARKEAEQHIRYLALHDALTGIANRQSFNARLAAQLESAARTDERFAVMCLDLDRFKEVNDLYGHAAGDALLRRVATILSENLEGQQFAARLGGDEFAVILPSTGPKAAAEFARSLLNQFEIANDSASDGTFISASIGIALYPDDASTAEMLMSYADTALYSVKDEGRGTYRFFDTRMGAEVRDRRRLEYDLRLAIATDQLSLVYQPQVDIASGVVNGFEALLRWTHPERGAVSPAVFIPIAEESGLVLQIGEWVMREACAEAAIWINPLSVAVNVSAVQLHNLGFPDFVEAVLKQTGLDPARLEIEITETALIRNMTRALNNLRRIKALGVRIAMDDFGTGYSSLSNLRAFPFDKIKVDQSFIRAVHRNDQAATIVRAVLELGRGLKLPILAEGVEDPQELDFLREAVCDSAQGYWFGKPREAAHYRDITEGRTRHIEPVTQPADIKARA